MSTETCVEIKQSHATPTLDNGKRTERKMLVPFTDLKDIIKVTKINGFVVLIANDDAQRHDMVSTLLTRIRERVGGDVHYVCDDQKEVDHFNAARPAESKSIAAFIDLMSCEPKDVSQLFDALMSDKRHVAMDIRCMGNDVTRHATYDHLHRLAQDRKQASPARSIFLYSVRWFTNVDPILRSICDLTFLRVTGSSHMDRLYSTYSASIPRRSLFQQLNELALALPDGCLVHRRETDMQDSLSPCIV